MNFLKPIKFQNIRGFIDSYMIAQKISFILIPFLLVSSNLLALDNFIKPPEPILSVRSFILIDANTGTVLAEKNSSMRIEPASLVKIMTSYVAAHALKAGHANLTDKVVVSEKAWRMEGSRMFIEVGSEVSVDSLLNGIIIQSGNDASVALAEHIYGSEASFVSQMNVFADMLGLTETRFGNVTGLPENETYTSARDMVNLSQKLIHEFPEIYKRFSIETYTYNNIVQRNRNILLRKSRFVDGIKTGYTQSADYCLISSGDNGSIRLIAAVIGAKTNKARFKDTKALLDYGFRFFKSKRLFESFSTIKKLKIWEGQSDEIAVGSPKNIFALRPSGYSEPIDFDVIQKNKLRAPIKKGQKLGEIVIKNYIGNKKVYDLIALDDVLEGSFFKRIIDSVLILFEEDEHE